MSINQYPYRQQSLKQAQQQNLEEYYAAMEAYMGQAHDKADEAVAEQKEIEKALLQEQQAQHLANLAQGQRLRNYADNSASGRKHKRDEYRLLKEKGQKIEDPNYPGYGGKKSKRRKTTRKRRKTTKKRRKPKY
jgi:hypothetical protein